MASGNEARATRGPNDALKRILSVVTARDAKVVTMMKGKCVEDGLGHKEDRRFGKMQNRQGRGRGCSLLTNEGQKTLSQLCLRERCWSEEVGEGGESRA